MKKLENQVRNEIFRQMSLTSTLALDVPVCPVDAKGLIECRGCKVDFCWVPAIRNIHGNEVADR